MLCSQPAFRGDYISSTARTRMALGRAHTSATQCLIHKNISGPIFFEISCYRVLYSFWPFHSMVKNHFYKLNNSRIQIQIRNFTKIESIFPCHTPNLSTKFHPNPSTTFWDIVLHIGLAPSLNGEESLKKF